MPLLLTCCVTSFHICLCCHWMSHVLKQQRDNYSFSCCISTLAVWCHNKWEAMTQSREEKKKTQDAIIQGCLELKSKVCWCLRFKREAVADNFWRLNCVATIKWCYSYDRPELWVPQAISSRGEQLLEAIWPFELWRENPQVLIKQFMDHWPKDMTASLMVYVTREIFLQNASDTVPPNSQKIAGWFLHLCKKRDELAGQTNFAELYFLGWWHKVWSAVIETRLEK